MKLWLYYIVLIFAGYSGVFSQQLIHFDNKINTAEDEFLPFIFNDNLVFGRTYKLETIPIAQYSIRFIENFSIDNINHNLEIQNNYTPNNIYDYIDSVNFRFNMIRKNLITADKSYFSSQKFNYDFHPAISPDGLYIVFVSDRTDKDSEIRKNTTDLFIIFKLADGHWSEPYNLGSEINSEQNEITPFIDNNHNLYFARKVLRNNHWNYDIFKAQPSGKGKWGKPIPLDYPVNTDFNETGAFVKGDTIFFASDRVQKNNKNVKRNYDIYCFVKEKNKKITLNFKQKAKKTKKIEFFNYEIPFFVTGYYYPNTPENLQRLRDKFETGILGNNPKLRYIENPDEEVWDYDAASILVEEAINKACYEIINELQNISDANCPVFLTFTGYSDTRKITDNQIYNEHQIKSLNPYLFVEKGESMNNLLLSKLRAFYTAMEVKKRLSENPIYQKYKDRIIFIVKGNGPANEPDAPDYKQRRVEITLKIDNNKKININCLPALEENELGMIDR